MGRDEDIRALMAEGFKRAKAGDYSISNATRGQIETLFDTTTRGFREVLMVVVLARLLDPGYKPSRAFYACHPRALYEGPILDVLRQRGIPAGKSGPLNVAKAAQGLNDAWAAQRSPKHVADTVVRLVKRIERMKRAELKEFSAALHARFMQEASRVATLTVEVSPESDPQNLYELSCGLIDDAPDGGNTPQRIVGLLMEAYHQELQTGLVVQGHLDSASVTSTTSKKPGDISEEQLDGTILNVYEVTVKRFGAQRVSESYDTLRIYGQRMEEPIHQVIVICRQADVHPDAIAGDEASALYLGHVEYQDVTYHFVDIYEWVIGQLLRMPSDARIGFHERLSKYIAEPNTSERVKVRWGELTASSVKSAS